jgi:hypothetical protein
VSTWGAVRSLRKCYMRSKLLYAFLQRKQWWSIKRINNSDKKTTIDNSVSRRNTNRRILTPISVSLFSFLCRNVNPWLALDLSSFTQLFHTFMLIIWNRHGLKCSRIWKWSGNFITSVEIFWAEIYWGRLFLGPNLVSFNRAVVPLFELSFLTKEGTRLQDHLSALC